MDSNQNGGGTAPIEGSADNGKSEVKPIRPEDHQRAINDMLKFKTQAQELAVRSQEYEAKLAQLEEDRLKATNDFKTMYEREKETRLNIEKEHKQFKEGYLFEQKFNAVRAAALKAGIRSEAEADLSLVKLDGVGLEATSSGRFLVHGADDYIEQLKKSKPHWFKSGEVPQFNSGGLNQSVPENKTLNKDELYQLQKKDPKKFREYISKMAQAKTKSH